MESVNLKYLLVGERDTLWGLTIHSLGKQNIPPHSPYPLHPHPKGYFFSPDKGRVLEEYQLLYITQGKGVFSSDRVRQRAVSAGDMFMLFPGEWHSYRPSSDTGWDEYWIGFRGVDMDAKVHHGFFSRQSPVFNIGFNDEVVALYQKAIDVASEQAVGYQQVLGGVLMHLLGRAYALDKKVTLVDEQVNTMVTKAKSLMVENVYGEKTPEDLAKELNLSYSSFRKLFKEYTGFAPSQYMSELKMKKAKELLRNTSLSIVEIAFELKFTNSEYFFTVFKKYADMTPIQYRNLSQGNRNK